MTPTSPHPTDAATTPTVSAVLAAYSDDRWDDLNRAIGSLRRQRRPVLETIIVIDRNPALLERVRAAHPDVRAVPNAGEGGAGGARNTGVALARGELVAFLDDDADAAEDWLEMMLPVFEDPRVLGVGGHLEPRWEPARPAWFPDEFLWVVGCSHPGLPDRPGPVRNLIAASMVVRRSVFEDIGGFRTGFGKSGLRSGTEETDLCIRAAQRFRGHVWVHHPGAWARHRVPPGRVRWTYFVTRCRDEGVAKAAIVDFVGHDDGLASERRYLARVLPGAVGREMRQALRGDPDALRRAGAIVAGVGVTGAAYGLARVHGRGASRWRP